MNVYVAERPSPASAKVHSCEANPFSDPSDFHNNNNNNNNGQSCLPTNYMLHFSHRQLNEANKIYLREAINKKKARQSDDIK